MPTATKTDGTDLRTPPPAQEMATSTNVEPLPTPDGAGWSTPMAGVDQIAPAAPDQPAPPVQATVHSIGIGAAQLGAVGHLGSRTEIQDELDRMAFAIRSFALKAPDQVMREVAAYGARLTELEVLLHRVENLDRQYMRVRTMQVQKWHEELDRQFKIASRIVEVQRQDLELLR